ncbi:rod-binding protein [Endozoicomonas lisbonensis]|uniref:Rod binding domain-containing protein n=1 Tax=Endozoicomonas lisbonensis TaxID=3120522 RepID=A0ABV2SBI7_9GAMM
MDILTLQSVSAQSAGAIKPAIREADSEDQALRSAAQDFEAMMVEQMLKSMRAANEALAEDGLLSSREQKFWQEFQDSQLAMELVRSQGLGLADAIFAQVQDK